MMNLFSVFDPASSMSFSFNWLSFIFVLIFLVNMYWFIPSRFNNFFMILIKYLLMDFKELSKNKKDIILFVSVFMMIMLNNFLGMFNYIFVVSSHLNFGLTFSLTLWLSFMLYGWIINMNHMFIHLLPQSTPKVLMVFMVLIETISNIIRPLTLAVRLAANMIAGHLLMVLISSLGSYLNMLSLIMVLVLQSLLIILELSVSIIQAYVFSVLILLYSAETN